MLSKLISVKAAFFANNVPKNSEPWSPTTVFAKLRTKRLLLFFNTSNSISANMAR